MRYELRIQICRCTKCVKLHASLTVTRTRTAIAGSDLTHATSSKYIQPRHVLHQKVHRSYLLTYLLHVADSLLRSQQVLQLVKKIPALYGTLKFITVFTSACHLSLYRANSIQSPPPPTSRRYILILSPIYVWISQWSLSLRFPH